MASLRKKDRSPFWWGCFTYPDGRRGQRSTKIRIDAKTAKERRDARRLALDLAESWEHEYRDGVTVRQAQRVTNDILAKLNQKPIPVATVESFLLEWAAGHAGEVSEATLTYYRSKVAGFLQWLNNPALSIALITDDHVRRYREAEKAHLAPRTINNAIKTLRMAFESARKKGLITDNPAEDIRPLKAAPTTRRPFTLDELRSLIEVADDEWKSMIRFGYYLGGQRLSDVASLRWSSIDTAKLEATITTRKTGRIMHCPITPPLLDHISALSVPSDPRAPLHPRAFDTLKRTGKVSGLSNQFADILASVGLAEGRGDHKSRNRGRTKTRAKLSFHSLRDTATTALKSAGVEGAIAQELVGHESAAMSKIYTKFSPDVLRAAAEKLESI